MSQKSKNTGAPELSSWEPRDWQCIAIIVALTAFFFRDILLGNAFFFDDFIYFSYPSRYFAATSMAQGAIPLWNPYTFSGMPFLADIQTAVLYLPYVSLTLFVSNGSLHFYWLELVTILHLVLAGVSMFFLAKSFGLRRLPALFVAIAFMFSGFMICRFVHQHVVALISWFPLIVLLFRRSIARGPWYWVFLTALVLGHSTLAGFPQITLYVYFFLFLFFLFEFATTHRGSGFLSRPALIMASKAACVIVLSVAAAMIQLLPSMELAPYSQRAQISYEMSVQGSLAWSQLVTFVIPKFFGSAGGEGYSYWGPGPYWYYWETCIYLGALPLMTAIISTMLWKNNKYVVFFCCLAIFALLFSLGNNFFVHKLFFDFVPLFGKFRDPARMSLLLSLSGALLSGFAFQHILYEQVSTQRMRRYRNLVIGLMGTACLLWLLTTSGLFADAFPFLRNEGVFSEVRNEALLSALVFVVSGTLLLGMILQKWKNPRIMLIATGILFADALLFGGHQNTGKTNPGQYFDRPRQLAEFLKKEGESEFFRVSIRNQDGMIMDRNQGMVSRLFLIEGFTPLVPERAYAPLRTTDQMFDLLNVRYKTVTDTTRRRLSLVAHPTYFPRAFFLYQVHVAQDEQELLAYLKDPAFDHRKTAVLEKNPNFVLPAQVDTPRWRASITSYESNKIVLAAETSHDGLLVLSETYYPGWEAFVDGASSEIYRTDYNLRGLFVAKGTHTVELIFAPETFADGARATIATLLVCVLGSAFSWISSKKKRDSRNVPSSAEPGP